MTREDIIRMARQAGWDLEWGGTTIEQVQNFAALVAAAEREACAKLCEQVFNEALFALKSRVKELNIRPDLDAEVLTHTQAALNIFCDVLQGKESPYCADAIRARGGDA